MGCVTTIEKAKIRVLVLCFVCLTEEFPSVSTAYKRHSERNILTYSMEQSPS
jgi:hypothetical protein